MIEPLTPEEIQYIVDFGYDGPEVQYLYPPKVTQSLIEKGFNLQGKALQFLSEIWHKGERTWAEQISNVLGSGMYGATYQLTNGNILKITWDDQWEISCVEHLVENNIRDPHLPIIYEYGGFLHDPDLYYYIREPLDDIPNLKKWTFDHKGWSKILQRMSVPLEEKYGINIRVDAHPKNFGIRPGQPDTFVLRDITCDIYD